MPANAAKLTVEYVQDILYLAAEGMPDTLLGHMSITWIDQRSGIFGAAKPGNVCSPMWKEHSYDSDSCNAGYYG